MKERCENCKYWKPVDILPTTTGECRRYPTYITRDYNDYCGEFTPKIKSELLQE
jgi:hypothetical protein